MKNGIASLVTGFIFALGLGISGMTQPQKVFGFLDLFGKWDPTLIFVMLGAIAVHFVTYKIIRKRALPVFDNKWHVPTSKEITPSLIIGSILFGFGWALGGLCPGPAITSLASFEMRPLIFISSMLVGMLIYKIVDKKVNFKR